MGSVTPEQERIRCESGLLVSVFVRKTQSRKREGENGSALNTLLLSGLLTLARVRAQRPFFEQMKIPNDSTTRSFPRWRGKVGMGWMVDASNHRSFFNDCPHPIPPPQAKEGNSFSRGSCAPSPAKGRRGKRVVAFSEFPAYCPIKSCQPDPAKASGFWRLLAIWRGTLHRGGWPRTARP